MPTLVVKKCPRCRAVAITHDVRAATLVGMRHGWVHVFEAYTNCRHCHNGTIFIISQKDIATFRTINVSKTAEYVMQYKSSLNDLFEVDTYISLRDESPEICPDHVPEQIREIYTEGLRCLAVNCFNAAGTMFRLCVDLVTEPLLPDQNDNTVTQPNSRQRRDLGLRLPWLFTNGKLPEALHDLASCIKDDGNDAAHRGTLKVEDARDIKEFTEILLTRLYTEPEKVRLAAVRRDQRRSGGAATNP